MDPHLRAVQNWNKKYLPSEKDAYHQARVGGYIFPQLGKDGHIGNLYEDELEVIASHPPIVDFKEYERYKNMSVDQLKQLFPVLVDIIGNSITHEDLFYYATRGWIPEYDSINSKIDRWNTYNELSDVGKSLMNMIYNNHKGYVEGYEHPLEKYILTYDQNMDDDSTIRSIAELVGIDIEPNEIPHEAFYHKLSNLIK